MRVCVRIHTHMDFVPSKLLYIQCHSHSPMLLQSQHFGHNGTCVMWYIFTSVCWGERRQTAFGGEKWVPCAVCWIWALVLWPVKGICLEVWGDMDVWTRWKLGWGGQVLILKHGCLSWSRPAVTAAPLVIYLGRSHQDWRLESWAHTPPLPGDFGAPGAGLLHRMSSQCGADWSHAF